MVFTAFYWNDLVTLPSRKDKLDSRLLKGMLSFSPFLCVSLFPRLKSITSDAYLVAAEQDAWQLDHIYHHGLPWDSVILIFKNLKKFIFKSNVDMR